MTRDRLQNWALFVCLAFLLLGVARIYRTFQDKAPLNLEGHIIVEGSMTANPAPAFAP
ncbi:MAG: hypothetical protein K8S25_02545 [Alphaproteobacteria bacterium]|nr:hypothetical protein [Alphaproteobacteria bacterium]